MSFESDTTVGRNDDRAPVDSEKVNLLSFDPSDQLDPDSQMEQAARREKELMELSMRHRDLIDNGTLPDITLEMHPDNNDTGNDTERTDNAEGNARRTGPGRPPNELDRDPFSLAEKLLDLKESHPDVFAAISDSSGNIKQDKLRNYLQAANDFGIFADKNSQQLLKTLTQLDHNFDKLGADGTITPERLQQLKTGQVAFDVLHLSLNRPEIFGTIVDKDGNITKENVDRLLGQLVSASLDLGLELPREYKTLMDLSQNFDRLATNGLLTPEALRSIAFEGRPGGRGIGQ